MKRSIRKNNKPFKITSAFVNTIMEHLKESDESEPEAMVIDQQKIKKIRLVLFL